MQFRCTSFDAAFILKKTGEQMTRATQGSSNRLQEGLASLRPLIAEKIEESEASGRLAPEIAQALADLKAHKMLLPKELGGAEASAIQALEMVEMVSYADASTGWVLFASGATTAMASAYLPQAVTSAIFGQDRNDVFAGSGNPSGFARPVDGGYRVSGKWSYGSGLHRADWVLCGTVVLDGDKPMAGFGGIPAMRMTFIPADKVKPEGNWDVLGLRATGSVDYSVDDVLVPEEHSFSYGMSPPQRRPDFFAMGIIPLLSIGHSAWAAGVGRRMLDDLAEFARSRTGRAGLIGESEAFWEHFGSAEAKLRSARAWLYQTWREGELSIRELTYIRLSMNHITWTSVDVCELAYRLSGGHALRKGAMQRIYRDMHAGSQHITTSYKILASCGRELAGLAEGKIWTLVDLIDPPAA
jgi:alkylation response protein AidB-like acyl-CoA dehydrogenase